MNDSGPVSAPFASPARAAFLRGLGRRAIVFTELQCGDPERAVEALAAVLPRFAAEARHQPMAQWPARFWGLLLAATPAHAEANAEPRWPPGLAGLGRMGPGPRAALLLWLVAGLEEADAAAALGVDAATWRLALQRARPQRADGVADADAWQALVAACREALQALPPERLAGWERACSAALASEPAPSGPQRPRWLLPMLWVGVAAVLLALAATFLWPLRESAAGAAGFAPGPRVPLAAPKRPAATFDPDFALRTHPDLAQLAAADALPLQDLDLLSWHAAQVAPSTAELAAAAIPVPAEAPTRPGTLQQRVAEWDALPSAERGARRERWQAWQHLPEAQRAAVLDAAARFSALPPEEQQALRMRFAQLPAGDRRGWLLGPRLGLAWPRLQPLLMQVPADEREPLLATLHELSPLQLDDLATLAQRTPPQERDALRRGLLAAAHADRTAWLQERLRH